ncbi:MAG: lysylphosphatidylglycerol synthase transmembrane domain-containing protein [Candidatus Berkelbacteria bacterium]|nr:lysylphosphatidylglycerol synthase transmembrane domain-containing protein [Candidatus Berkelbacteria bacterium]
MKIKFGWKFWVTLIFGLLAYGFLFYELFFKTDIGSITRTVGQIRWYYIAFGLILGILMIILQGSFLRNIFALYKIPLSFKEAIWTWLYTVPLGAVTAGLSGPAIIFYKARRKNISFEFATLITATYFIFYTASSLLFIFLISGSSFYRDIISRPSWRTLDLILLLLAIILIFILFHRPSRTKVIGLIGRIAPKFFPKGESEKIIGLANIDVLKIVLSGILISLINLAIFTLSFAALKIDLTPFALFKNFAFFMILSMFSPSGGGLGFVELGLAGSLKLTGLTIGAASVIIVSFRLINFWLPAILGWLAISVKGIHYIRGKVTEE